MGESICQHLFLVSLPADCAGSAAVLPQTRPLRWRGAHVDTPSAGLSLSPFLSES